MRIIIDALMIMGL